MTHALFIEIIGMLQVSMSVKVKEPIWEDCSCDGCLQRLFVRCKGTLPHFSHPLAFFLYRRVPNTDGLEMWNMFSYILMVTPKVSSKQPSLKGHLRADWFDHLLDILKFYWRQLLSFWHLSLQIQSRQLFLHKFKHFPDVRSSEAFYCFWSGQTVVLCSPADTATSVREISGAQVRGGFKGFSLCRTTAFDSTLAIWLVS